MYRTNRQTRKWVRIIRAPTFASRSHSYLTAGFDGHPLKTLRTPPQHHLLQLVRLLPRVKFLEVFFHITSASSSIPIHISLTPAFNFHISI
ncbi:hypothetical protein E2C01_073418 [Portunus trituberculatus]|uniref:Uncharacterized protein n=1 Tax=Portunus trituberculatus TaxID=210409 RepID=A0A5B7I0M2_PORTR|nr:hypothetical protein [Portunus trituberculatus]